MVINAKTIDDKYPLPDINTALAKLDKSQYFSTIDLASAYHQITTQKDPIEKNSLHVR